MKGKTSTSGKTRDGLPDCKKCMKANGGKCPDAICILEPKDTKTVIVSERDVHALLGFAINARFFLLAIAPKYKKGTKGERLISCVDNSEDFLLEFGKRIGYKEKTKKKGNK